VGEPVSVLFVVLGVLFTPVFRFTWMRSLRRQCAHFEELAALEIVVAHLVEGAAKRPSRVPWVLYLLRGAVDFLFQPDNKSPKSPFPDIPYPPDRRRSWTARFDRHDPARDICYYRVQLFRRNRAAGELYVEIPAGFARLHSGKLKELQTQLARVIATGKSNVLPQP